jgi:hypothetical protein
MKLKNSIYLLFISTFLLTSCGNNSEKTEEITLEDEEFFTPKTSEEFLNILDEATRDTILANIITYIYKLPTYATLETKFNNEFRQYYVDQIPNFTVVDFRRENNTFYMLILRPARNVKNHKRTVAVKFDFDEEYKISNFEEIFNTPMVSVKDAVERGIVVFQHYLEHRDLGKYFGDLEYVEFPDTRTRYNKETHEWYYPKELEEQFSK